MINDVLAYAKSMIGTKEGLKNDNPFAKIARHANNQPWCMTFIYACFVKGNAYGQIMNTASCPQLEAWAKKNNQIIPIEDAQPGDIALFDFSKKGISEHVGLITAKYDTEKKEIHTIEGNTSDGSGKGKSQANGDGVYSRHRSASLVRAVVRPKW